MVRHAIVASMPNHHVIKQKAPPSERLEEPFLLVRQERHFKLPTNAYLDGQEPPSVCLRARPD